MGGSNFTWEYIEKIFKNLLLKNYLARKAKTCVDAFSGCLIMNLLFLVVMLWSTINLSEIRQG